MTIGEMFANASIVGKLGFSVAFAPVAAAILYAVSPNERRLAWVRPLSLAALFAGLTAFMGGVAGVFEGIGNTGEPINWRAVSLGASETAISLFVPFGCLTITWLVVAFGLRRAP